MHFIMRFKLENACSCQMKLRVSHLLTFKLGLTPKLINILNNIKYCYLNRLRLGMRLQFGIRNVGQYLETWLGGSMSQSHVIIYSRSNNRKSITV